MDNLKQLHVVIVGAGVTGLQSAWMLVQCGVKVTVFEKQDGAGGVWKQFANDGSRVQVPEPAYRLPPVQRVLTTHSSKQEVLHELEDTVDWLRDAGASVVFGVTVAKVNDSSQSVVVEYLQAGRRGVLTADHVIFCVGGLQEPRKISYPGESVFKGTIVYGVGGEPDKVNVRGKHVLILGLGSYAVENGRECLYRGAEHVTFLARSRTRMVTDLGDHLVLRGQKPATEVALDMLSEAYERCSVTDVMPPEIQEFKFQKDLVSLYCTGENRALQNPTSDAFFVGHALGKMNTVMGEVAEVLADGVKTTSGQKINASVVIKCLGFEGPQALLQTLANATHMHSPVMIRERVWCFPCDLVAKISPDEVQAADEEVITEMFKQPQSGTNFAKVHTEIFFYFQERPQELRKLLQSGHLPYTEIGQLSNLTLAAGHVATTLEHPVLAKTLQGCRRQLKLDMRRWTLSECLQRNHASWRAICERMTGNEEELPYIWEHLKSQFEMLDEQAGKSRTQLQLQVQCTAKL